MPIHTPAWYDYYQGIHACWISFLQRICKDNLDKRFADCLIPQEMSNADINAELDLSDYSCEDDDYDGNRNCTELKCSGPTGYRRHFFVFPTGIFIIC